MSHRSGQFMIHGGDVDFVTCSRRRYGNNRYKIVNNQFFNSGSPCQQHHRLNRFKSAITLTFETQLLSHYREFTSPTSKQMSSNILADRTNCQPKVIESSEKEKPKTMEYHRQVLESRIKDGQ